MSYSRSHSALSRFAKHALRRGLATAESAKFPQTRLSTLPNGLRVATENSNLPTATIGVWIDAGSRYEDISNNGTAHFLEHLAFKGTKRRSQYELELEVENMGAHLNAYTSREQTVYYAKCLSSHLDKSMDILSDILLQSRLDKSEVERERGVILREAEEVAQNFQEVVFDRLHEGAFQDSSLALTILGPDQNIKSLQPSHLRDYVSTHYKANRMVVAAAGGVVSHEDVVRLSQKYFGHLESGAPTDHKHEAQFTPCELRIEADVNRTYGAICIEGASWTHADSLSLMVANTMLGEWDRSRGSGVNAPSRLARIAASVHGIQSFQAFNTCYKETGLAGIYYVCEPQAILQFHQIIADSWNWLAFECDEESLARAKQSLYTNLQLMLDGSTPVCEDIGRQILCYGRRLPAAELAVRLEAISVSSLREVARRRFLSSRLATCAIGQIDKIPSNAEMATLFTTR